jgi:hypothetical protein
MCVPGLLSADRLGVAAASIEEGPEYAHFALHGGTDGGDTTA